MAVLKIPASSLGGFNAVMLTVFYQTNPSHILHGI